MILYPSETTSHGLWSRFFACGCTLVLVYPDLIPSFIGLEGFKVLGFIDGLVISQRFCLRSRFLWHHLIQAYTPSRSFVGGSPSPFSVLISRCLFFSPDVSDFPLFGRGTHI